MNYYLLNTEISLHAKFSYGHNHYSAKHFFKNYTEEDNWNTNHISFLILYYKHKALLITPDYLY